MTHVDIFFFWFWKELKIGYMYNNDIIKPHFCKSLQNKSAGRGKQVTLTGQWESNRDLYTFSILSKKHASYYILCNFNDF